jgi:molybdate transport system substrate-binding protein
VTSARREGIALDVISGGAAQGIVGAIAENFRLATGAIVRATFGAVGAMRERLLQGAPCDAIILTAPLIAALEAQGHVSPGASIPLGQVRTGIGVRDGERFPAIADGTELRASLVAATGIYFPDPVLATAGIHFMKVLRELGIEKSIAERLHPFPNGAAAMAALARSTVPGELGCTQITEIKSTPGVALVGPLPAGFGLATIYTVAVCTNAREPDLALVFAALLSGPEARAKREMAGFE